MSKRFPVLFDEPHTREARARLADIPRMVPWEKVEPLRASCMRMHDQTLERLAERGGLGISEFYVHVHGLGIRSFKGLTDDVVIPWFKEWAANV